jgi:hypothetical protein
VGIILVLIAAYAISVNSNGIETPAKKFSVSLSRDETHFEIESQTEVFGMDVLPLNDVHNLPDGRIQASGVKMVCVIYEYQNAGREQTFKQPIGDAMLTAEHRGSGDSVMLDTQASGKGMTVTYQASEPPIGNSYYNIHGKVIIDIV